MNIHDMMEIERIRLEKIIKRLTEQLKSAPKGSICCSRNSSSYKYRIYDKGKKSYFIKDNPKLAEELAIKAFNTDLLKKIVKEKKAIETYLTNSCKFDISGTAFFNDNPGLLKLVQYQFHSKDKKVEIWENVEYSSSAGYPEYLQFNTLKGNLVRSKSEVIIANLLYTSNVPYRYECDDDKTGLCPDFTLLNPDTMITIPWDHLGMLDSPDYAKRNSQKLNTYWNHGLFPTHNLILTYESENWPLDSFQVERSIEDFWRMSSSRRK